MEAIETLQDELEDLNADHQEIQEALTGNVALELVTHTWRFPLRIALPLLRCPNSCNVVKSYIVAVSACHLLRCGHLRCEFSRMQEGDTDLNAELDELLAAEAAEEAAELDAELTAQLGPGPPTTLPATPGAALAVQTQALPLFRPAALRFALLCRTQHSSHSSHSLPRPSLIHPARPLQRRPQCS